MDEYALVLNAGSSSLKFTVFRRCPQDWRLASKGHIEHTGATPRIFARDGDGRTLVDETLPRPMRKAHDAVDALARWLRSIYSGAQVLGVGHRVVHGGARHCCPTVITPKVLAELHDLSSLAPLHQPHNLAAIEAVTRRLPEVPQVACFDTSFHRGQPTVAQVLPLPREICNGQLQRYGFHGLSYESVSSRLPQMAPDIAEGRVIVAHLGSGASLCALKNQKSIDCTFSFTALDGLCMGTRPGALDPGVILYLFRRLGLTMDTVEYLLYKKSGLLGISGISSDMRDLLASSDPRARLALDYFVYRATKEIGSLAAVLGGIDGLVFTGGIGENSPEIRRRISECCGWLGVELDADANRRGASRISAPSSRAAAYIIPTNEELIIARHTGLLLGLIEMA